MTTFAAKTNLDTGDISWARRGAKLGAVFAPAPRVSLSTLSEAIMQRTCACGGGCPSCQRNSDPVMRSGSDAYGVQLDEGALKDGSAQPSPPRSQLPTFSNGARQ